jgi:hypothetical protein
MAIACLPACLLLLLLLPRFAVLADQRERVTAADTSPKFSGNTLIAEKSIVRKLSATILTG